jgi:hypothetical protein
MPPYILSDPVFEFDTRWLQETNSTNTTASGMPKDSSILRDMVMVYGSIFVAAFIGFCWVRKAFPKPYTVRMWTNDDDLKVRKSMTLHCFYVH